MTADPVIFCSSECAKKPIPNIHNLPKVPVYTEDFYYAEGGGKHLAGTDNFDAFKLQKAATALVR